MTVVPRDERRVAAATVLVSRRAVFAALAFTVVGAGVLSLLVSFMVIHAHHGIARVAARIVPVPAAVVDGRVVWYATVVERAIALETVADVPHEDAMARALVLAKRRAVLDNLAAEFGIEQYADQYVLAKQVEAAALGDAALQATARGRLERVQLKYEQGIRFADLAGEYGEGAAALTAGSLGYVNPMTLPEDLKTVASTIAGGEVSDIVETTYAFWLVKAEDVIESEDGTRSVWLRVIEVKKDLLGDVVDERLEKARVREFLF